MGALDCVKPGMRTDSTEVFTINLSNTTLNDSRRDLESQQLKSDSNLRHSYWWSLAIDVPLFILVLAFIGLFELNIIPSHKAGFFCRDPSLDHAFTGDTVSMKALCLCILLLPIPILWVTEWIFSEEQTVFSKSRQASIRCLRLLRVYIYGFLFNLCIIEALKGIAGSPRPTFNAICKPDTWQTCKDSEYVTTFQCTSDFSTWFQNDASHSFPSGHTSLSVYCALFLTWYLQNRAFCWSHRTVFLVPFLQLALLTLAALASLTRITDHRHHWWDVLCGFGIGLAATYYAVVVISNNFLNTLYEPNHSISENSRLPAKTILFDGRRGDTTP